MWTGDNKLTIKDAFDIFEENLKAYLSNDERSLQMSDIDLVFFPIIAHGHYFLIVVNLKRAAFTIIDNSSATSVYSKYVHVASVVRKLIVKHLTLVSHRKAKTISNVRHSVMSLKWGTKKNHVDCGVFLMCHMDQYIGEAASKWSAGFVAEDEEKPVTQ